MPTKLSSLPCRNVVLVSNYSMATISWQHNMLSIDEIRRFFSLLSGLGFIRIFFIRVWHQVSLRISTSVSLILCSRESWIKEESFSEFLFYFLVVNKTKKGPIEFAFWILRPLVLQPEERRKEMSSLWEPTIRTQKELCTSTQKELCMHARRTSWESSQAFTVLLQ